MPLGDGNKWHISDKLIQFVWVCTLFQCVIELEVQISEIINSFKEANFAIICNWQIWFQIKDEYIQHCHASNIKGVKEETRKCDVPVEQKRIECGGKSGQYIAYIKNGKGAVCPQTPLSKQESSFSYIIHLLINISLELPWDTECSHKLEWAPRFENCHWKTPLD